MGIQQNVDAHGIMFHHFHGSGHPVGQGSISADDLVRMLAYLQQRYNLLPAQDFATTALAGTLQDIDICLTFDDALLCQYEIAAPVLERAGVTAFYFVYSSVFTNSPDLLEVYRFFRSTRYEGFDDFCDNFMQNARQLYPDQLAPGLSGFDPSTYLIDCPFYSTNDRLFRYIRDRLLAKDQYNSVMNRLMEQRSFVIQEAIPLLYLRPEHLLDLQSKGNIIGLHSHSHPLSMRDLTVADQRTEYTINAQFLTDTLGESPRTVSHPMGSYNAQTLAVLRDLGVEVGFRANRSIRQASSLLEIPREDHANILSRMGE